MATRGQPTSRFLLLPAELRDAIYHLALMVDFPLVAYTGRRPTRAALLRTCHQIRKEATEIFYQNNIFHARLTVSLNTDFYWPRPHDRHDLRLIDHFEVRLLALTAENLCFAHTRYSHCTDLRKLLVRYIVDILRIGIRVETIRLVVQEPFGVHQLEKKFVKVWDQAKEGVLALARGELDDENADPSMIRVVRDAM